MVIAGKEIKERLFEIIEMLNNSENTPQVEFIVRVMKQWARDNDIRDI